MKTLLVICFFYVLFTLFKKLFLMILQGIFWIIANIVDFFKIRFSKVYYKPKTNIFWELVQDLEDSVT